MAVVEAHRQVQEAVVAIQKFLIYLLRQEQMSPMQLVRAALVVRVRLRALQVELPTFVTVHLTARALPVLLLWLVPTVVAEAVVVIAAPEEVPPGLLGR